MVPFMALLSAAVTSQTMPKELLARYEADPLGVDAEVRRYFKVPENRYYSVSTYPPSVAGRVTVTTERDVKARKISKSDA